MVSQTQNKAINKRIEPRLGEASVAGGHAPCLATPNVITLSLGKPGNSYKVISLDGNANIATRLAELGFTRGSVVYILQKVYGGLKVKVNGSEYALGNSVLNHIYVVKTA